MTVLFGCFLYGCLGLSVGFDRFFAYLSFEVPCWAVGLVTMVCHRWDFRPHKKGDDSCNDFLVGRLTWSKRWRNNHHADLGKAGSIRGWM